MPPTPEPDTRQSLKGMYIVLIVATVLALGLNLFNYARKPTPWPGALGTPLVMVGFILMAWAGLLSTAKTGAQRILRGLSLVCVLAGVVLDAGAVLEILTAFRL